MNCSTCQRVIFLYPFDLRFLVLVVRVGVVVVLDAVQEREAPRRYVVGEQEGDVPRGVGPERQDHQVQHQADEFGRVDLLAVPRGHAVAPVVLAGVEHVGPGHRGRRRQAVGPGRRLPPVARGARVAQLPFHAANGVQVFFELLLVALAEPAAQVAGVVEGRVEQALVIGTGRLGQWTARFVASTEHALEGRAGVDQPRQRQVGPPPGNVRPVHPGVVDGAVQPVDHRVGRQLQRRQRRQVADVVGGDLIDRGAAGVQILPGRLLTCRPVRKFAVLA